jgi:alpha-tubulin suppressor-like RCC1 family protein
MAIRSYPIRRYPKIGVTSVWTWGSNDAGQLGDGTLISHLVPEQVTGIGARGIAGIAVGDGFELALGADGSVWAWGADGYGQLGIGPQFTRFTRPVQVSGLGGASRVTAGWEFTLALYVPPFLFE